ncbi:PAS domain-containing protein [Rhizobium leguminosarum]|nr:PAS domain-containing protein [Rhizobium leguminosarum]
MVLANDAFLNLTGYTAEELLGKNCRILQSEALLLGIRRAGVTDELHILESMHAIRSTRGNVHITDRNKLIEIAGGCYGVAGRRNTND